MKLNKVYSEIIKWFLKGEKIMYAYDDKNIYLCDPKGHYTYYIPVKKFPFALGMLGKRSDVFLDYAHNKYKKEYHNARPTGRIIVKGKNNLLELSDDAGNSIYINNKMITNYDYSHFMVIDKKSEVLIMNHDDCEGFILPVINKE